MVPVGPEEIKREWLSASVGDKANFFEFVIQRLIEQCCTTGCCAIDAGANYGAHTSTILKAVGPTGAVFAFEPNPHLASKLESWRPIHPNLAVSRAALTDRSGEAQFLIAADPGYGSLHAHRRFDSVVSDTVTVQTARLDDFPEFRTTRAVDFIKADVEGAEIALLHGAAETLRQARPLMVMELDWGFSLPTDREAETKLFGFLDGIGYGVHSFFGQELSKRDQDCWNVILSPQGGRHETPQIRDMCLSAGRDFFLNYRGWNPYQKFEAA